MQRRLVQPVIWHEVGEKGGPSAFAFIFLTSAGYTLASKQNVFYFIESLPNVFYVFKGTPFPMVLKPSVLLTREKANSEHKGSTHWVVNHGALSRGLAINKKRGTQNRFGLWFFLQAHKHETEMDAEMGNSPNQKGSQIDGRRDVTSQSPLKAIESNH